MPSKEMTITEIGNTYELKREQWQGNAAYISKDPNLLSKIKKYTWTLSGGDHPYLRNSRLNISMHEFVLSYIYGEKYLKQMLKADNIIEHLDNNGLNCAYENLHILSSNLNKAKAFTIDKSRKKSDILEEIPPFITDVYYSHEEKYFQLQIFMNDDIFVNKETGKAIEMFYCIYNNFNDLFHDWYYILNTNQQNIFNPQKFLANRILFKDRPSLQISPQEINNPFIIKDGECYINLSAKKDGQPLCFVNHTALRNLNVEDEENKPIA